MDLWNPSINLFVLFVSLIEANNSNILKLSYLILVQSFFCKLVSPIKITLSNEPNLLGTGGTLKKNLNLIKIGVVS